MIVLANRAFFIPGVWLRPRACSINLAFRFLAELDFATLRLRFLGVVLLGVGMLPPLKLEDATSLRLAMLPVEGRSGNSQRSMFQRSPRKKVNEKL